MNYTKTAFSFLVAALLVVMPSQVFALETASTGTSAGQAEAPATASTNSSAGTATAPATESVNSSAASVNAPATAEVGSSAATPTAPSTASVGTSAGTATAPDTTSVGSSAGTPTPSPSTNGGNTNTGNGSGAVGGVENKGNTVSSSSSGGGSTFYNVGYSGCAFSSGYIEIGTAGAEVTKLQNFLKGQGFSVVVTGSYDAQTVEAVKNFQSKYSSDILAPWGITNPTGYVYITTSKKINQISCSTPLNLTAAELATINATKAAVERGEVSASDVFGVNTNTGTKLALGTTTKSEIASNGTTSDTQVATASKAGVFSKIWSFVKRIFGR